MNPHPFFSDRKVVVLLACLCCLLWGSAYPAIKNGYALFAIGAADVPSKMVFAGYRFVIAGALLLLMARLTQRPIFNLDGTKLRQITTLGLTQTSLQYIFFYVGLAYTTGVKGSIMNATGTFFSVLLAHFIYHNDRLSLNKVVGCLVGFVGVMVVNFNKDLLDFDFSLLGEGSVVMAAFILSAASIYGKKVSQSMDSIVLTGYQLGIGGVALLLGGYLTGGTLTGFTLASTALLLYLAVLSSVAFALWTILLKYNRVGMVTIFNFLIPIFGAILSAIFLGESILEWKNVFALVLVCSGIWLVNRESR
ncbi:DMT family transporter [Rhodoferax sp.]|uniref:DMT family transporter n=1 Tax=Rhodoferax sp. TaxID=50421 RepID=UPI00272FC50B|nr:DMT family transporter [Rhodoferax sp.]MDP1531348.1 DMT family transporter [Rhodoferax sp.]MDP1944811.1 DMT family transporter [Rhodoferax sp.]MDP2443673.1 DMT family transporter [Rhodoferax sp.]MDP3190775.1 DMT family transporter [Rhodoferax sp.]MDP3335848.1 DMT family transporter [Rhodoferax sp.]